MGLRDNMDQSPCRPDYARPGRYVWHTMQQVTPEMTGRWYRRTSANGRTMRIYLQDHTVGGAIHADYRPE